MKHEETNRFPFLAYCLYSSKLILFSTVRLNKPIFEQQGLQHDKKCKAIPLQALMFQRV
jgi:hypothetical protein